MVNLGALFFTVVPIILSCSAHTVVSGDDAEASVSDDIIITEHKRCGEIIDMHLHLSFWYTTVDSLLEEMDNTLIDRGVLYAVYPPLLFPGTRDANDVVSEMVLDSGGRIAGFASLNTTHPDWNATRDEELGRLSQYLDRPEFVGAKLAPPHTCLPLKGERIEDVVATVAASSTPLLAIHVGTTPYCGPIGKAIGFEACCSRDYVSPALLTDLVDRYPDVTFILLHAGHDFLPMGDPYFYNGTMVGESIKLTQDYGNVYLEISAMHAENEPEKEDDFKYPGGDDAIKKIVGAGLANKIIWGSDDNHNQGSLGEATKESFEGMVQAGMTDDERCMAINGLSKDLFGFSGCNSINKCGEDQYCASNKCLTLSTCKIDRDCVNPSNRFKAQFNKCSGYFECQDGTCNKFCEKTMKSSKTKKTKSSKTKKTKSNKTKKMKSKKAKKVKLNSKVN